MDLSKLHEIVEKLFTIISKPPYDDIDFRISNNKGLYEIYIVFNLSRNVIDELSSGYEAEIRFEGYRLLKTINNYLNLKIIPSDIVYREKK